MQDAPDPALIDPKDAARQRFATMHARLAPIAGTTTIALSHTTAWNADLAQQEVAWDAASRNAPILEECAQRTRSRAARQP